MQHGDPLDFIHIQQLSYLMSTMVYLTTSFSHYHFNLILKKTDIAVYSKGSYMCRMIENWKKAFVIGSKKCLLLRKKNLCSDFQTSCDQYTHI